MLSFIAVAPEVERLALAAGDGVNVYLLGDVLVDAGGRGTAGKLLRALDGRRLRAHALTHAHFDHQGSSHAICETLGLPLWCGEGDREAVETGKLSRILPHPRSFGARVEDLLGGPAHPVARVLREGDELAAGFVVLETPGHTPGSISFWREADRVLILGDVAMHRHPLTRRHGLQEPISMGTVDRQQNRESLRRLAALDPAVVCFGHGEPFRDPGAFRRFADGLGLPVHA